jgi:hypothetical protein
MEYELSTALHLSFPREIIMIQTYYSHKSLKMLIIIYINKFIAKFPVIEAVIAPYKVFPIEVITFAVSIDGR